MGFFRYFHVFFFFYSCHLLLFSLTWDRLRGFTATVILTTVSFYYVFDLISPYFVFLSDRPLHIR